MLPQIIGLASPAAQCGKSTVAGMLVTEYGYVNERYSAPLKHMWAALCLTQMVAPSEIARSLDGDLKEQDIHGIGFSFRTFAELVGTRCVREMIDYDAWVKMAEIRFMKKLAIGQHLVIEDVRFPNECDLISKLGGVILYITRPGFLPSRPSEGHIMDYQFDARFWNRDKQDFLTDVRTYLSGLDTPSEDCPF